MKTYMATVTHELSDNKTECLQFQVRGNSFCMAVAYAEQIALTDARTGVIIKIDMELMHK